MDPNWQCTVGIFWVACMADCAKRWRGQEEGEKREKKKEGNLPSLTNPSPDQYIFTET